MLVICGAHLRGLTPGQYRSEETSQRWRAVSDTVSGWSNAVVEHQTYRADNDVFDHYANWVVNIYSGCETIVAPVAF